MSRITDIRLISDIDTFTVSVSVNGREQFSATCLQDYMSSHLAPAIQAIAAAISRAGPIDVEFPPEADPDPADEFRAPASSEDRCIGHCRVCDAKCSQYMHHLSRTTCACYVHRAVKL